MMAVLPSGSFTMGDLSGAGEDDQVPAHAVTIPHPFAMMKYEVTFSEYDLFAQATGAARPVDEGWGRGSRPAINVSWGDANAYAEWLSEQTGERYRLPSEAEWEYAARAGSSTEYSWGDQIARDQANYGAHECCRGIAAGADRWVNTSPVGAFQANPWGLHDMHGNVWEWVQDCYRSSYLAAPADGSAWRDCDGRHAVMRGGSWHNAPARLRAAFRNAILASDRNFVTGFRLVRELVPR